VHIYTHDTVLWALSGGNAPTARASVKIGDCVYIGSQSVIAAGVTIGSRCVVGANSFVNRDVPDGVIVGGSPARRLGRVVGAGADVRLEFDHR
jgi:acetyltransferase-like isoleucine patch superfamily enzyme